MQVPAAMFIEAAADALAKLDQGLRKDQEHELVAFGDARFQAIGGASLSLDARIGYELGLQTAREMIRSSVALAVKGVNPEDVL